jgi:hypothetical protein
MEEGTSMTDWIDASPEEQRRRAREIGEFWKAIDELEKPKAAPFNELQSKLVPMATNITGPMVTQFVKEMNARKGNRS